MHTSVLLLGLLSFRGLHAQFLECGNSLLRLSSPDNDNDIVAEIELGYQRCVSMKNLHVALAESLVAILTGPKGTWDQPPYQAFVDDRMDMFYLNISCEPTSNLHTLHVVQYSSAKTPLFASVAVPESCPAEFDKTPADQTEFILVDGSDGYTTFSTSIVGWIGGLIPAEIDQKDVMLLGDDTDSATLSTLRLFSLANDEPVAAPSSSSSVVSALSAASIIVVAVMGFSV